VFVADTSNARVRRIGADGNITTFAGNGLYASLPSEGQKATDLAFQFVGDVAVDAQGSVYVAGGSSGVVRIGPDGIVHIVAGTGGLTPADGAPALSVFLLAERVAIDSSGVVYVVAPNNFQTLTLWKITPDHIFHRVSFRDVNGLLVTPEGTVYISTSPHVVGIVSSPTTFTVIAGVPVTGYAGDGQNASQALFSQPAGLATDKAGNLFIVDGNRVRKLSTDGTIQTYAGDGTSGSSGNAGPAGDGGPAIHAQLNFPTEIAVDLHGNLYISDYGACRVRKVDLSGTITTFAGTGAPQYSYSAPGPATSNPVCPTGIAVDPQGNVYVGDPIRGDILKITTDGTMSLFLVELVPGVQFPSQSVAHLAVDAAANLYYRDTTGIVRVSPSGSRAGVPGSDLALTNRLDQYFALDALGNVFVANTDGYGGSHLRKIDANGSVSSVANGYSPNTSASDGPAFYNSVGNVAGMAIDKSGNLYFSDASRARVRMVAPCTAAVYPFFSGNTVVHGATYLRNYVSPGQVLAVFGSGLGPQQPAFGQATSGGRYPTKLAGVQVFVNSLPAPLLYVSASQINAVAPFELPPGYNASVQITYNDTPSELVAAGTSASVPGIFTASQNGQGQAAALNQDGSVNSSTNPAHPGTVVRLYFTGAGQTSPAGADGALTGPIPPTPVLAVSARIGGQTADVVSTSGVEGVIEGVLQVKLRIPAGVTGDALTVELTVGATTSPSSATLAVR
jgi:uncharacterized protein (TIGR03437 family)